LRGQDLNLRPSGYEPDELPGCSTPRRGFGLASPPRGRCGFASPFALAALRAADVVAPGRRASRLAGVGVRGFVRRKGWFVLGRPGDDLLSHVLRQSTIGAEAFDGRVRDGIGSDRLARATRPAKNGFRTTEGENGERIAVSCPRSTVFRRKQNRLSQDGWRRTDDRGSSVVRSAPSVLRVAPWRREQSSRTSD
jgi:hypothetical protein